MSQQDKFDRIIASLHEAMLGDAHWRDTSILIDDACGMKGSNLAIVDEHSLGRLEWVFDMGYFRGETREELGLEYVNDFFPIDERVPRILRLPDRRVTHVTDLLTASELKSSPTYNDLLFRAQGQDGLMVRMDGPNGQHIVWAFADPVAPDGWQSGEVELIKRLLPHIRQFVRIRQTLADANALGETLSELLENGRFGVLHLNSPRGRIARANDRALEILRRGDGLFDRGGFLRARLAVEDTKLQRLLANSLGHFSGAAASGSMTIGRKGNLSRLVLHVNPLVPHLADFGTPAALVLVVDPESRLRIDPGLVGAAFDLTRAESRVAVSIAEGSTVRNIAMAERLAESSVRWHIRQIYAKLGISRQADLVRIVLSVKGLAPHRS